VQSLADLAICEAGKRYKPEKGAAFSSFVYFYLKGILICQIRTLVHQSEHEVLEGTLTGISSPDQIAAPEKEPASEEMGPEEACHCARVRSDIAAALAKLTKAERSVLYMSDVLEIPMTHVATTLGYSRGHLHEIRRKARHNITVILRSKFKAEDDIKWAA